MNWQPIETAPKDGSYVLLTDSNCVYMILVGRWKKQSKMWWGHLTNSGRAIVWRDATHWMPLPEPPHDP